MRIHVQKLSLIPIPHTWERGLCIFKVSFLYPTPGNEANVFVCVFNYVSNVIEPIARLTDLCMITSI